MKPVSIIFITITGLFISCYKPYDADIDTDKKVLVVNGMMTNETASYNVQLTYATPFDSSGAGIPVKYAKIYVTDNLGNIYFFHEKGNGNYASDSLLFTGIPGNIYTLYITTEGGDRYESDPQKLFPAVKSDSVYAEFDYQETLSKITGMIILSHGANILTDIRNESDNLPRFRFMTNLVTQYVFVVCGPPFCIFYYCWQTENTNQYVNLTGGDYSTNSASVNKHSAGFIEDGLYCFSLIYFEPFMISSRVIYLNQYTLNNEAYFYYKSIDELLRSEGKLFDPISTQINGNIKCLTHPENKVFGFFEASSVCHTSYKVDFRNLINGQPSITMIPYILPAQPKGVWENIVPPFWVN